MWYETNFGYRIKPYNSTKSAINTWPTTATSIGIRKLGNGYEVYAPFGLDDLLNMVVRPNKLQITESIYNTKIGRWLKFWPDLKIVDW